MVIYEVSSVVRLKSKISCLRKVFQAAKKGSSFRNVGISWFMFVLDGCLNSTTKFKHPSRIRDCKALKVFP